MKPRHLVSVEDDIQLADVLKALVHGLDKDLDEVEDAELALGGVDREDEVEGRIVPVNQHGVTVRQSPFIFSQKKAKRHTEGDGCQRCCQWRKEGDGGGSYV